MPRRILDPIRAAIRNGTYDVTAHANDEMAEDKLDLIDVETAILNGTLIKTERDDPRGARYTIHGTGADGITPVGTGKIELRANISSLDKECSVEGIRLSLISKVGLESYMTEGREVVFQDVLPGLSTLEITQGEKRIGEISIDIKGEGNG